MKTPSLTKAFRRNFSTTLLGAIGLLALGLAVQPASAEIKDLIRRAPADANAIVAVDVATLLGTPIAKAQGWGTREDLPLFLQRGTDRLLIATRLNLATMDSDWEVALLEMSKAASLPSITLAEAGLSDKFGDLPAVWSSRHAYFIAFEPQVLGIVAPDDRQFAARWARQQAGRTAPAVSTYLQASAGQANSTNAMVIALDLQDAISLKKVQRALVADLSRATLLKDIPSAKVADLLVTLKGVTVKMQFASDISGTITLDFGADPAMLTPVAGSLLNDVLSQNGMGLPELESWKVNAAPGQLVYNGKLTVPTFMKLSSLLQPSSTAAVPGAAPAAPVGAAPAGATPAVAAADPQAVTIAASQKYFKAISSTLDGLGQPASLGDGAAWLKRASQRIEKLPMANVDAELLAWGTSVSADLLGLAQQLALGQTQVSAKSAGTAAANAQTGGYSDSWDGGLQVRADNERLVNSQREASQMERARVAEPVARRLSEIMGAKVTMRAAMVQRYKVEF